MAPKTGLELTVRTLQSTFETDEHRYLGTAPLPAGISHAVDQTSPFSRGDQGQDMAWRVPDQDLIHCGSGFLALSHQAISA